jgi:hypothetical protein
MRRLLLPLGIVLASLVGAAPADARGGAADAVRTYREALMRIVRQQETYAYKDMDRDLRRAYEVFIKPWLDRGKPNAPTEIEYDFKAYRAVFEKWVVFDRKKAEAALELGKVGDIEAAKALFGVLKKTIEEIQKQDRALQKLRPKAFSVFEQEPAIRWYGARIHADGLVAALGSLRNETAVSWLAEDAWKTAVKRDKSRRADAMQVALLDALGGTESSKARELVAATAAAGTRRLRIAALENLARITQDLAVVRDRMLEFIAEDPCFAVRAAALETLIARAPDPLAVPALAAALRRELEGPNGLFRALLHKALCDIVGKDFGFLPESWLGWFSKNEEAIRGGTWKKEGEQEGDAGSPPGRESVTFYDVRTLSKRILALVDASDTLIMPVDIELAKKHNYFHWSSLAERDRNYVSQYELLVRETLGMVDALKPDARFNIVVMHGSIQLTSYSPKRMAPASVRAKKRLRPFLEDMVIAGWAPQHWSLWAAYEMAGYDTWGTTIPDEPEADTIFLLSDGAPCGGPVIHGPAIVDDVRRRHRFTRIPVHTIRIANCKEPSEELMKGIAEVTGGTYVWRKKP